MPSYEGTAELKKIVIILLVLTMVLILFGLMTYLKVGNIYTLLLELKASGVLTTGVI